MCMWHRSCLLELTLLIVMLFSSRRRSGPHFSWYVHLLIILKPGSQFYLLPFNFSSCIIWLLLNRQHWSLVMFTDFNVFLLTRSCLQQLILHNHLVLMEVNLRLRSLMESLMVWVRHSSNPAFLQNLYCDLLIRLHAWMQLRVRPSLVVELSS